ncbi:MAG: alpha/beta fold hydrolase, partial [Anaeroplasmataceae bacterium]|nr:alpha/beta fold hydrolase [Anaeroplasmataceae bacterium]
MFHGLLSSKEALNYYQKNLDYLYDEILCYDLPGHGENLMKFNTLNIQTFVVGLYDQLSKKFDEIDVLGYSMGGVIACYLQSVRRVHKMILLAPAYRYLNFNNYHFQAFKTNKNERSNFHLLRCCRQAW